ncbi:hypothetical protein EG850_10235 [Gulosibacter macacae]|uniref:TQXA domain-containing protein n=1 Tax=Gulosibacter macacae TaxID=2488791 RepID=A0A3P3VXA6_9MICO|nr:hypothetical protein [Gulosibacter macacae]RRJ86089.1 hypothetical protein EG850_10235 [Gulosibacter macacae]
MPSFPSTSRRTHWRVVTAIAVAALLTTLLLFLGGTSARAAEAGPGFSPNGQANSFVGAMSFDGSNAYCIELTKDSPIGAPTVPLSAEAPMPTQLAALSANDRARLNWAISTTGASANPVDAAATAIYVWWLADPAGFVLRDRNDEHYLGLIPAADRTAVRDRLAALRSGAAAITAASAPAAVSIELVEDARGLTLRLGEVAAGSHAIVQVRGGTMLGERVADGPVVVSGAAVNGQRLAPVDTVEMLLPAGSAREFAVSRESGLAFDVTVTVQLTDGAWSPDLRVLVTEGRQLLIQSSVPTDAVSQARFAPVVIEDAPPVPSATPDAPASPEPTRTPVPEPTVTPEPTDTPAPTDTAKPTVSPEPSAPAEPVSTPKPEPTTTPEPGATPESAPTTEPEPKVDVESEPEPHAEPKPNAEPPAAEAESPAPTPTSTPASTPPAVTAPKPSTSAPARPTASESPTAAPTVAPELASTGALFDPVTLLVPLGLSVVLLAAGGWAMTRSKRVLRDDIESSW